MHTKKEKTYTWIIISERYRSYLKKRKLGKYYNLRTLE